MAVDDDDDEICTNALGLGMNGKVEDIGAKDGKRWGRGMGRGRMG